MLYWTGAYHSVVLGSNYGFSIPVQVPVHVNLDGGGKVTQEVGALPSTWETQVEF